MLMLWEWSEREPMILRPLNMTASRPLPKFTLIECLLIMNGGDFSESAYCQFQWLRMFKSKSNRQIV